MGALEFAGSVRLPASYSSPARPHHPFAVREGELGPAEGQSRQEHRGRQVWSESGEALRDKRMASLMLYIFLV